MNEIHVAIAPEKIFELPYFLITNSILTTFIVSSLLVLVALLVNKNLKKIPNRSQSVVEMLIEIMYKMVESVAPHNAKEFFPYIMTIFIFVLFSNLFGLLPGVGTFGISEASEGAHKLIPLIRPPTSDLNTTLALALMSVVMTQYFGLKHLGYKIYLKKYFNFNSVIDGFVGFLELIAELAKILSFTFRLFGNVFAGEVLLSVMLALVPILIPLPFFGLELFAGFIQAVVFAILTLVFWSLAVEKTH